MIRCALCGAKELIMSNPDVQHWRCLPIRWASLTEALDDYRWPGFLQVYLCPDCVRNVAQYLKAFSDDCS